jgi:hypothetical protein
MKVRIYISLVFFSNYFLLYITSNIFIFLQQMALFLERMSFDTRQNNVLRQPDGKLIVRDNNGQDHIVSNRYGWSAHNCQHDDRKTGLVLYPYNTEHKNVVLLLCESCYGYKSTGSTQHTQLQKWYYDIYTTSKQYRLASGFSRKSDGSLGFNSYSQNAVGPYTGNSNTMNDFEKNIVRKVVQGQLDSYTA